VRTEKPRNIREIVSCKPDFLGFIFYPPSPRYVGESFDARLMRNIPPYINKTGVFVNQDADTIIRLVERYSLDFVQLHGEEDASFAASLKARRIGSSRSFMSTGPLISKVRNPFYPSANTFYSIQIGILRRKRRKIRLEAAEPVQLSETVFLSGGIAPDDGESIAAFQHPYMLGIDINSGFETSAGVKDVYKVNEFIKIIKKK